MLFDFPTPGEPDIRRKETRIILLSHRCGIRRFNHPSEGSQLIRGEEAIGYQGISSRSQCACDSRIEIVNKFIEAAGSEVPAERTTTSPRQRITGGAVAVEVREENVSGAAAGT